jgi:large subunit ribosomal protein L24
MDKIRKNDEVIVLTGKDKGKRGVVSRRVMLNTLWLKASTSLKKRPSRTQ